MKSKIEVVWAEPEMRSILDLTKCRTTHGRIGFLHYPYALPVEQNNNIVIPFYDLMPMPFGWRVKIR